MEAHIWGSDGSTEGYIHTHGFNEAIQKLGWHPWDPVNSVKKDELNPLLYRYLIGIGYLFPEDDNLIVHPNHLRAHVGGLFTTSGTPFIRYRTHRCAQNAAEGFQEQPLTDEEMWTFFGQLTGMGMAGFPSLAGYGTHNFHEEPNEFAQWHLDVGAHLTPQRYIELEPKIETYEWLVPDEKPDNPSWR